MADIAEAKLHAAVQSITDAGGEACGLIVDVSSDAANKKMVEDTVQKYGRLDLAFVNAGISGGALLVDTDDALIDSIFDTNTKSVIYAFKHMLPAMKGSGGKGSIVITSSCAARGAYPAMAAGKYALYSASKVANEMLMQFAAIEGAEHGTRVNAVAPGFVSTGILGEEATAALTDEKADAMGAELHLYPQRAGRPEEVSNLVCFLLSDNASFINGSTHIVDAGYSIKH